MFRNALNSRGFRLTILGFLILVPAVWAASRAAVASSVDQPAPGVDLPQTVELFYKLSPRARLLLLQQAGLGKPRTHKVTRGVLRLDIVERGAIEPARNLDVICLLKNLNKNFATTVKWVIDDGAVVKKGEKLVEFDDSSWREELNARTVDLTQALAGHAKARERLKLVQTDSEIDVRLAEIALQLAQLRLQRDKGEDRNHKEELQLKVEQCRLELQRARAQARNKAEAAQAELAGKAALVEVAKGRKAEVSRQLSKCVIAAPRDGVVTYYVPETVRGGRTQQTVVAVGEPVREGQKLLQMPDLSEWQVNVRVHESHVAHLRSARPGDVQRQRALIRVDAFPERVLEGYVKSVDAMASQQDWFASDVKIYKTIVAIDKPWQGIRPGMSADAVIAARQTPGPVVQAPVEAVLAVGKKRLCFVIADSLSRIRKYRAVKW